MLSVRRWQRSRKIYEAFGVNRAGVGDLSYIYTCMHIYTSIDIYVYSQCYTEFIFSQFYFSQIILKTKLFRVCSRLQILRTESQSSPCPLLGWCTWIHLRLYSVCHQTVWGKHHDIYLPDTSAHVFFRVTLVANTH